MTFVSEDRIHELYAAYCEFKTDATRSLMADTNDPKMTENVKWVTRAMPKADFAEYVRNLQQHPERMKQLTDLLAAGWQEPDPQRSR